MTFNKMNAHTMPIFIQLEFLKIEDIRQLQLLSFVYDCLNKTVSVFYHDYFTPSSECHIILIQDKLPVVIFFWNRKALFSMV